MRNLSSFCQEFTRRLKACAEDYPHTCQVAHDVQAQDAAPLAVQPRMGTLRGLCRSKLDSAEGEEFNLAIAGNTAQQLSRSDAPSASVDFA